MAFRNTIVSKEMSNPVSLLQQTKTDKDRRGQMRTGQMYQHNSGACAAQINLTIQYQLRCTQDPCSPIS